MKKSTRLFEVILLLSSVQVSANPILQDPTSVTIPAEKALAEKALAEKIPPEKPSEEKNSLQVVNSGETLTPAASPGTNQNTTAQENAPVEQVGAPTASVAPAPAADAPLAGPAPASVTPPSNLPLSVPTSASLMRNTQMSTPLSVVIKERLAGIEYENKIDGISKSIKELEKDAREYIDFRKGQMKTRRRVSWVTRCLSSSEEVKLSNKNERTNIYCDLAIKKDSTRLAQELAAAGVEAALLAEMEPPSRSQIPSLLEKGDLSGLRGASRGHIYGALRRYKAWEPLEKIVEKVSDADACDHAALLTALGQKAEEFFPEPRFRTLALSLYEKAVRCTKPSVEVVAQARYRYSLLKIWDGRCNEIEPILEKLSEDRNGEFASRSLYWRAYCAKENGQKLRFTALRSKLVKEFPLSYHGILLTHEHGKLAEAFRVLGNEEPEVLFRSQRNPDTTPLVRAVEVLQAQGAHDLARAFLFQLEAAAVTAEPAFRLYVGVLMHRSGEFIGQFRTLAGVFRDSPSLISQATLKLFYPLKQFDILEKYGARLGSYFVAALIRQESGFNERARSRTGAQGLMQLMPGTARLLERGSQNRLYNPQINVRLGVKFFQHLADRYGSDAELALAAYNAGPERVDDWKRRYPTNNRVLFFDLIPFKETRDYVALIARNYYWYLSLYGDGPRRSLASKPQSLIFTLFR